MGTAIGIGFGASSLTAAVCSPDGAVVLLPGAGGSDATTYGEPDGVEPGRLRLRDDPGTLDRCVAIVDRLRSDATAHTGAEIAAAVVTVPGNLSADACGDVRAVLARAGFREVTVIDEAVAAALAFGADSDGGGEAGTREPVRYLVHHLEDHSFSSTVVEVDGGRLRPIARIEHAGGAKPFDDLVEQAVIDQLPRRARSGEQAEHVRRALVRARQALATQEHVREAVPAGADGPRIDLKLARQQVMQAIAPGVAGFLAAVQDAVHGAAEGLTVDHLGAVYVVGPSSYVPLLHKAFNKAYGRRRVPTTVDPVRATAFGAALVAAGLKAVGTIGAASGGAERFVPRDVGGRRVFDDLDAVDDIVETPQESGTPSVAASAWFGLSGPAGVLADRQYLACLVAARDHDRLVRHVDEGVPSVDADARYALALLVADDRPDEALAGLRRVIDAMPDHGRARALAFTPLGHEAARAATRGDWPAVADAVTEAVRLGPAGDESLRALDRYRHALPVGHLRAGHRAEATAAWVRAFAEHPDDARALHSLALAYYWWARSAEGEGRACPIEPWGLAIACWVLLVNTDTFWTAWRLRLGARWGFEPSVDDVEAARSGVLGRAFVHVFQSAADEAAQRGERERQEAYEGCLTALALEEQSSACWRQALGFLGSSTLPSELLAHPGGVGFFGMHGLVEDVRRASGRLHDGDEAAARCGATLRVLFAPGGLGTAFVEAETRGRPDVALAHLDRLTGPAASSIETTFVRASALTSQGHVLAAHGQFDEAMRTWALARARIVEGGGGGTKAGTGDPQFVPAFRDLGVRLSQEVAKAARKVADQLKADEKPGEAVGVLDRALEVAPGAGLEEVLCVALCDRAFATLKAQRYDAARADFERALTLKKDHDRARQGLATVYNNQGVDAADPDTAVRHLRKALDLQPDSHNVRRNLAMALRTKAVRRWNQLEAYNVRRYIDDVIGWLEEGVRLAGTNLKDEALPMIRLMAEVNEGLAKQLLEKVDDELVKAIIGDLITMYKIRKDLRGG